MNLKELDKQLNLEEVKEKMEEKSEFEALEDGKYEVALEKLELGETKKGDPKVTASFKIVAGDCEDRLLFINKTIQPNSEYLGWQLKGVIELLNSFDCGEYDFQGFEQLEKDCKNVTKEVESKGYEYLVELKTKKDFQNGKIVEVYKD